MVLNSYRLGAFKCMIPVVKSHGAIFLFKGEQDSLYVWCIRKIWAGEVVIFPLSTPLPFAPNWDDMAVLISLWISYC
jgi:hypothetical protein